MNLSGIARSLVLASLVGGLSPSVGAAPPALDVPSDSEAAQCEAAERDIYEDINGLIVDIRAVLERYAPDIFQRNREDRAASCKKAGSMVCPVNSAILYFLLELRPKFLEVSEILKGDDAKAKVLVDFATIPALIRDMAGKASFYCDCPEDSPFGQPKFDVSPGDLECDGGDTCEGRRDFGQRSLDYLKLVRRLLVDFMSRWLHHIDGRSL